jgi:2-iminobutanoate/2-iminopropanoate deaminase
MPRIIISTEKAPKPAAVYSQAVKHGKMLYTAGQVAFDPKTGKIIGSTIEEQTRRTLENLKAVLEAAGYHFSDILKVNIFLKSPSDFQGMNKVYQEYFPEAPPARTTVQAEMMDPNLLIELEAVACKD